jgi:carbon dioxide concentrating mechanism protein CcmN
MKSSLSAISFKLPSFPVISETKNCIIGNVTIHPDAAIAPGVVIQAAKNSQVIIEAGACIGMGVVINAYLGKIVIKQGAVLGARVLIIGKGTIGDNACIGAATTIFNSCVESLAVIQAYSIIGDSSRLIKDEITEEIPINNQPNNQLNDQSNNQTKPEKNTSQEEKQTQSNEIKESSNETQEVLPEVNEVFENLETENLETENLSSSIKTPVVGQIYINNLLLTLFPNRQSINLSPEDD